MRLSEVSRDSKSCAHTAHYQHHARSQQSLSGTIHCCLNAASKKTALSISGTMVSPNILVACKHPCGTIRKNNLGREPALVHCNKFLTDLVSNETCFVMNVGRNTRSKCSCLHDLREDQERLASAAEHMWHFHNLNRVNQHQLVTQWIHLFEDQTNKKGPHRLPVWG